MCHLEKSYSIPWISAFFFQVLLRVCDQCLRAYAPEEDPAHDWEPETRKEGVPECPIWFGDCSPCDVGVWILWMFERVSLDRNLLNRPSHLPSNKAMSRTRTCEWHLLREEDVGIGAPLSSSSDVQDHLQGSQARKSALDRRGALEGTRRNVESRRSDLRWPAG